MVVCLPNLWREALQVSTLTLQVTDLNSQLQQSLPGTKVKGRVAAATTQGRLTESANGLKDESIFLLSLGRTAKDSETEKCRACQQNRGAHRKKCSASET